MPLRRRFNRPFRLRVAILAMAALLLQAVSPPPAWDPQRDDPFLAQASAALCTVGHADPASPAGRHDHTACPACQPAPVPWLMPPAQPGLALPRLAGATPRPAQGFALARRPAPPYASRAPPGPIG